MTASDERWWQRNLDLRQVSGPCAGSASERGRGPRSLAVTTSSELIRARSRLFSYPLTFPPTLTLTSRSLLLVTLLYSSLLYLGTQPQKEFLHFYFRSLYTFASLVPDVVS